MLREFATAKLRDADNPLSVKGARIVSASDAIRERHLFAKWEQLLDQHSRSTLFYQSPEYFKHLAERTGRAFLAIIEADDGTPIGIVPMRKGPVLLKFELGEHRFAQLSFPGVRILGGTLLVPQTPDAFELLFQQIARSFPDCAAIEITGLPTNSLLWSYLNSSGPLKRSFTIYAPNGSRICHTASVPESFDKYLAAFGHKKQYNLRRQIRRLNDLGGGSLKLQRIDRVCDVQCFDDARKVLEGHSREASDSQISKINLLDFAERGLLLSYVLSVNGKPCALALGTRFRDTLVLHHFRHDAKIGHLSPGTVLQTLMMKELSDHKIVRRIDYGFGEPRYRLANDLDERLTVAVVRKGIVNQSLIASHRSYVRLVDGAKNLMRIVRTGLDRLATHRSDGAKEDRAGK